ncbi:hypothetical protein B0H15DRAFT_163157 [Mycena belliarum]|uniref:Uncharacterized protein n=1 Tax=Mycena belliarum TaxID=1033014 RepID=A0AAD6XWH0_9AGAR|nr:hypothetical protein B0H15DRAFT_163157 [Mycena belliae]
MRYLDKMGLVVFEREGRSFKAAPWVLTTKVKQRLEVVPIALPTGRDLLTHRGSGSENRYIIIASRSPIPKEEKAAWRTLDSLAFGTMSASASSDEGEEDARTGKKKTKRVRGSDPDHNWDWLSGDDSVSKKTLTPLPKKRKLDFENNQYVKGWKHYMSCRALW